MQRNRTCHVGFVLGSALVFFLLFSAPASATVIDDFTVFQSEMLVGRNGEEPITLTESVTGASSTIIGTERTTTLTATGTATTLEISSFSSGAGGAISSNDTNTSKSTVQFVWDGTSTTALNADLSADSTFRLYVDNLDVGTTNFQIDLIGATGTDTASTTNSISSTEDPRFVYFHYSSFTTAGSFSFSAVSSITLTVIGASNSDIVFHNFGTTVPEPSTFALLGAVCVGLCIYQRRRKRSEKAKLADDDSQIE